MNIKNIRLVAHFEKKTLLRDPVFRIISILGLTTIFIMQYALQGKNTSIWYLIALPSSIPFVNTLLFTFLQIFLVIVSTSEWRRTEKYSDTLESFRTRQVSNAEYILGKGSGIVMSILILNIISLFLALLIHLLYSPTPLHFSLYIFYFFTLSIPSLIFLIGIALSITGQIKQQGLSILILFLLFVGTTYFLANILHGLFDFRAKILPNVFSDITGHVKLYPYLIHRAIFLFLGIAGIIYSISVANRLPNNTKTPLNTRLISIGSIIPIIFLGMVYYTPFQKDEQLRSLYQETSLKYTQNTYPQVKEHWITLEQNQDRIIVQSQLKIKNTTRHDLNRIILYLNPGLNILQLNDGTNSLVEYNREHQVLEIHKQLPIDDSIILNMKYEGNIDERICYLDIQTPAYWNDQFKNCPLHFGKRYAYVSDKFTLLTPECYWYPVTIPIVDLTSPYSSHKDFTLFHLKVIPNDKQLVISQGDYFQSGDHVSFHNRHQQQGISLCMGNYERRSIHVDSLILELYTFRDHFHFKEFFENIPEEKLRAYLRSCKERIEHKKRASYPFNKFVLAETPVSFTINYRPWANNTTFVQPEIMFIPERWITQQTIFSRKVWNDLKKQQAIKPNLGDFRSIEEIFLTDLFTPSAFIYSTPFTPGNIFIPNFLQSNKESVFINNPHMIYPMFFDFSNYWYSENYPIINKIMYLLETKINIQNKSLNDLIDYKVIQYLSSHSFKDAINDTYLDETVRQRIFLSKTFQILYHINLKISTQEFYQFIADYKRKNAFQVLRFDSFLQELKEYFGIDLTSILPHWYNSAGLPSFKVKDFKVLELTGENSSKFQMQFKIYNNSDIDGIIATAFSSPSHFYYIPARTCWEIIDSRNLLSDSDLNLGLCSNMPNEDSYKFIIEDSPSQEKREGIFPCDPKEFSPVPGEVIVDNEDDGFKLYSPSDKRWLNFSDKTEKEYIFETFTQYSYGRILPSRWTTYISHDFYGETTRGAVCKLAGKGDYHAEWTTELAEPGKYEIFIYESPAQIHLNKRELEQNYTITTRDGEEQVVLKKVWNNDGWISLGEFYLNAGTNKIILSDKGSHPEQMIVADAVKWKFVKNKAHGKTKR